MALVDKLYALQQVDQILEELQNRRAQLYHDLADRKALEQARQRMEELKARAHKQRQALEEAEQRVHHMREKLRALEQRLAEGTDYNPREAMVIQEEISYLYKKIDETEDKAISLLMEWEQTYQQLQDTEAALKKLEKARARVEAAMLEQIRLIEEKIEELKERRRSLAEALPQDVLSLYEELRQRKSGLAVALVEEGACSACGTILSASLLQEAKDVFTLTRCPQCGRVLYAP